MKRSIGVGNDGGRAPTLGTLPHFAKRTTSPSENVSNAVNLAGPAMVTLLPDCNDARPASSKLRGSRVRAEASDQGVAQFPVQSARVERAREVRRRQWQWEREKEKERARERRGDRRPRRPKAGGGRGGAKEVGSGAIPGLQKSISSVTLKLEGSVVAGAGP